MKLIVLLSFSLVSCCISSIVFAQKNMNVIQGRILTHDSIPAYVTVALKNQKKITTTDNGGNFKFADLKSLHDTLIITSAESQMKLIVTDDLKGKIQDLGNIYLDFNITRLQDIEVKGRTARSYKSDYSFLGTKTQTASIDIPQSISTIT